MTEIAKFLEFGFIQRALIAGSFVGVVCAVLGVLLVLRRLSLIGDGLAHVTFGSVAIGMALNIYPLYAAVPAVILSSLGIMRLTEKAGLFGDAAIGIVSSLGIAGGVILASVSGGFNVDLFSYLFGNILSIRWIEVLMSASLSIVVVGVIVYYYNEIFSLTFDEEFAKASGIDARKINSIVVVLTGITVVLTMKVVGIMLASALLILPAVTAFQIASGFRNSLIIASVVSVLSVIMGIALSFVLNLPTGATVVMVNFLFFILAFFVRSLRTWNKAGEE